MTDKHELQTMNNSPATFAMGMLDKGVDVEKMERLLEMQIKWEANEARKAFHEAMAAFKAEAPVIGKDKSVSFGANKTAYNHASLAHVVETITPILSKNGLSVTWEPTQSEGGVKVRCVVSHVLGHSQTVEMVAPPDSSGSKNSIQAIGSTASYLARYTIMLALGLASRDMDDDGAGAIETITEDQAKEIGKLLEETAADKAKFLEWAVSESIASIPAKKYGAAVALLNAKKRKTRTPGQEG